MTHGVVKPRVIKTWREEKLEGDICNLRKDVRYWMRKAENLEVTVKQQRKTLKSLEGDH